MKAMTIAPYTNVRKMEFGNFWDMVDAQRTRHDEYTYTLNSTVTYFDIVYSTADYDKSTVAFSEFLAHIRRRCRADSVAIVMQHCDAFDMVFVIVD